MDYVPRLGYFSAKSDRFDYVAAWLEDQNYEGLENEYLDNVTDTDQASLTFVSDRGRKVVRTGYLSASPPKLFGIAVFLLGIENLIDWKPSSPVNPYLGYYLDDSAKPALRRTLWIHPVKNGTVLAWRSAEVLDQCKARFVRPVHTAGIGRVTVQHGRTIVTPTTETTAYGVPRLTAELVLRGDRISVITASARSDFRRARWKDSDAFKSRLGKVYVTKTVRCSQANQTR